MTNLAASVAEYNSAAVPVFDAAAFMAESIQKTTSQATDNTIALLRGTNAGLTRSESQSYYGGGNNGLRGGGSGPRQTERPNICTSFLYGDCDRGSNCRFQHPPRLAGTLKDTNVPAAASAPLPLRSALKEEGGRTNSPSRPAGHSSKLTGTKRPGSPQGPRKIQFGKAYNAMEAQEEDQDQQDGEDGYGGAWKQH